MSSNIDAMRMEKSLLRGGLFYDRTSAERQIISETVHALKVALKRARKR